MKLDKSDNPSYYFAYPEECSQCGSTHVFLTFDHVRVCRHCTFSERIEPRPVNLITREMKWKHERDEKMKRKVEARLTAKDVHDMVKSILNIPT